MAENGTITVSNNPTGSIWNAAFWKGASERSIKTAAQAFVGAFLVDGTTDALTGGQLTDVSVWAAAGLVALASAVLSLVMSIANPQFVAGVHDIVRVPDATPVPSTYEPKHLATTEEHDVSPVGSTTVGGAQ